MPWFHPTFDRKEANITIEHLLCHTSGIPAWTIANLPTGTVNTANLVSNTEDLSIWLKAQLGILERDITTEKIEYAINMCHSYPIEKGQHYFAEWNLYDTYFCHSGNNPNFSSQVIVGKTNKKAVFALSNICGSASTKAADGIYRMLLGKKLK